MKNKQFRQGDVLVERVENETKNGAEVPRENGRVILAHEAVAWSFGKTSETYAPIIET